MAKKSKSKKHKKGKKHKTAVVQNDKVATAIVQEDTVTELPLAGNKLLEKNIINKPKRRKLSQAFVHVLRPNDAANTAAEPVVNRTASRNTMRYIKFMFLGLTRTNQTPVAKGTSSSSSSSNSNKANNKEILAPTTFPCAFENDYVSNSTVVIDIGPTSKLQEVQTSINWSLHETAIEEGKGEEYVTEPIMISFQDNHREGVAYKIETEAQWKQSLADFHVGRRRCRRDVLDTFMKTTLSGMTSLDPDIQMESLQCLRETATFEELYTHVPPSCIPTLVKLLLSNYHDVRQGACEVLWALCFASQLYCAAVCDSEFLEIVMSNDFLPYVKAKGGEGALMCRGIGGILATLAMKMDVVEEQLLESNAGVTLCNIIMNGAKVGKDNSSPVYALYILLELASENTRTLKC